jgi:hypothetical protein
MSVIDYKVIQVGKDFPANWYTDMDQGLYSFEDGLPVKESLPIDIPSGSTKKVFVRIGLMMTPDVFQLVKSEFYSLPASEATLRKIWRFLYTKETDFYGNKLTTKYLNGSEKISTFFPKLENLREQEFVVSFTTSRGQSVKEPLSWYKFGGPYDERRYQMR